MKHRGYIMEKLGYIQDTNTGKTCVTFYQEGEQAQFSDALFTRIYDLHGINIPALLIDTKYPEIKDRAYRRIYPDDGELFQRAFLDLEFPRIFSGGHYVYVKADQNSLAH